MSDDFGAAIVDAASTADSTPVTTNDSDVSPPSTDSTTTNNNSEFSVETAETSGAETEESSEHKETETHNADGSEKTLEQIEKFKANKTAKGSAEVAPQHVRNLLKQMREADPKNAQAVKDLHSSFERWNAVKNELGTAGVQGLRDFLNDVGAKTLPEARESLAQQSAMLETVKATDELLYTASPELWKNVVADLQATGHPEALGKLAASFAQTLKENDVDAFYSELAKPLTLAGMDEAGLPAALNSLHKALVAGDMNTAKAITKSIADFYVTLRDENGEKAKISKERQQWEQEKSAKETESQKAERTKIEQGIAEQCDKVNNTLLGKFLGGFLRLPFFREFPRETLIDLGNGIKERLYASLKADKNYQTAMTSLWKAKTLDREKMVQVHQTKLQEIGERIVRETVQQRYPSYAKGGMSAGRAAASADKKVAGVKAAAQSISTMRPIYVASRPENLIRDSVTVGGKTYDANALQTLQITGRGFVRSGDGKSLKVVSWRKA